MSNKCFKELAEEAIDCTKNGLEKLIEVYELQQASKNFPVTENYQELIEEIIEKEKIAVSLIHQATLMIRGLMDNQHHAVQKLINNL